MNIGVTLRNMGPQSDAGTLLAGAVAAESLGFESLWITDHLAIPPDDAQGSEGRYLDPLITLAWLAQATQQIKLGTGVLIVPYRPALPTAKQIATLAELAPDRLVLGVGVGWMEAEFTALGLERRQRGKTTDATLALWRSWFDPSVEPADAAGQKFLFRPKPTAPPILVGGAGPHAHARALELGDGWLPMARDARAIASDVASYRALAAAAGQPSHVSVMGALPLADDRAAQQALQAYRDIGVDRFVCALRYDTEAEYIDQLQALASIRP